MSVWFNEGENADAQMKEIMVVLLLGWSQTTVEQSLKGRGNTSVSILFFPPGILSVFASGCKPETEALA